MSVSTSLLPKPITLGANLAVRLLSSTGEVLAWRAVRADDLADIRGEIWLREFLEQDLGTSIDDVAIEVDAVPIAGTPVDLSTGPEQRIRELRVGARGPGRTMEFRYDSGVLRHVALGLQEAMLQARAEQKARDTESQTLYHDVVVAPAQPAQHAQPAQPAHRSISPAEAEAAALLDSAVVSSRAKPPTMLDVPLSRLPLRPIHARAEGDEAPRVYITAQAFERAKAASRAGASQHPPIETGAILLGTLCRCPESGRLFLVVIDALPLRDDVRKEYSLTLTSLTWSHVMAIVRARQTLCPAIHLAGQAHGHNWDPGPKCSACDTTPVCGRTTLFLSHADVQWQRAVFPEAPWACAMVFGSNARGQLLDAVFAINGGRYTPVSYGVIEQFDSAAWPVAGKSPELKVLSAD